MENILEETTGQLAGIATEVDSAQTKISKVSAPNTLSENQKNRIEKVYGKVSFLQATVFVDNLKVQVVSKVCGRSTIWLIGRCAT